MAPRLINSLSDLTLESVADFRAALSKAMPQNDLNKTITQATGLVAYDLQAPSKNLIPVLTPLRNKIARVGGGTGTATNWKAVLAINTSNLRGFVPEGKRNGQVNTTVVPKTASYKTMGMEDAVTFEAERAGAGFEDVRANAAMRLLWALMMEEELADLGGNASVDLGTPGAPTVTVVDGGGTIADGTYAVRVVALTLQGFLASSLDNGVVGSVAVTNPVGGTFSYGGGSSNKSNATSTGAISNGNDSAIRASVTPVTGAVAYAWYMGVAGSEKLQAITTINSVEVTALLTTTQAATAITADNSKHAYGYDGILYQALATGSNAYIKTMATGTAGTGTPLTADNAGGIVEIDDMLYSLWVNYKLSPTVIYVNAQESKNITKKVLASSGAQYTINTANPGEGLRSMTAGAVVANYLNKFAMGGSQMIPIIIHPYLPAGTMLAVTEQLPYPMSGVANVIEKKLRRDYYQIEWPQREREYETGVYFDGVLAHYFTPSIGIIQNIANG